jgi:membrane fusion protein, multidrug efflux system
MSRFKPLLYCCVLVVPLTCASCTSGSDPAAKTPQATAARAPVADAIKVLSQRLKTTVLLPSELIPYESVAVYPKVTGFVKWIKVDRGSQVRTGEVIAQLEAPEIVSESAEAQAKLQSAQGQLLAARAKLAADQSTYEKLKAAAATPGVVAKNELVVALQAAQADAADVQTAESNVSAAQQSLQSIREMEGYLQIRAPFDGVVTERNVHPGALVGPASGTVAALPMVRVETLARLRLIVPVPETYVARIPIGANVSFTVPAFTGETFTGRIARISHVLDQKTRTMPVELDVMNPAGQLAPGSFSDVLWPVERARPTLFVPSSAVASTLERIFVVRIKEGAAEWVDVKTGVTVGSLTEVFGNLRAGDTVLVHGTDEVRPGSRLVTRFVSSESKGSQ